MSIDDHLEFRLLKYFVAVVEVGTFTAAAARLHVAQSAVSTQIRALEDILNVQLFDREHSNTLTTEGRLMYRYAKSSLKTRTRFIQTLQAIHSATLQPLRLGFSPFVQKGLLHSVSAVYKEVLPDCEMAPESGDTGQVIERIRNSKLDTAIITLPVVGDDLEVHVLEREPLVVCMRNTDPLVDYEAVPPSSLNNKISIFTYQKHHPAAYDRLLEMFAEIGITTRPCEPTQNIEHVQWMVREGHCYSLMRARRTLMNGLVTRPIAGVDWTIDTALVVRADNENPALYLFMEELLNHFRQSTQIPEKKPVASIRVRTQGRKTSAEKDGDQIDLFAVVDKRK
ncbi:LysR family transcriptional regulator [Acidicapsa ligni]|uniref:LysR family transcriptional regulator n=1 Tax=Acidicapsa ligni TaxID=542300 RepID=UPI0021E02B9B|nr:LysR family transcriptional regulator [Acidicapsa ligni]